MYSIEQLKEKLIDLRWYHGVSTWEYSRDCNCFCSGTFHQPPTMYCLGDRMIHADYGYDSYGIYWTGSTSQAWHGGVQTNDLGEAIRWIKRAKYKKLGCWLWGEGSIKLRGNYA